MYFREVCEQGDIKHLEKILTWTTIIDFNETDEFGQSGFFHACCEGHVQVVKLLCQKSKDLDLDLNKAKKNGWNGFHSACNNKHEEIVDFLIENAKEFGIDLSAQDQDGDTGYDLWPEKFQS